MPSNLKQERIYRAFLLLFILFAFTLTGPVQAGDQGGSQSTIVLIIDDLGNNLERGMQAIGLPGDISYAILPHTPNGESLANAAEAADKEVLLHAPMANLLRQPLGPGALTSEMNKTDFIETLRAAIAATPHLRGVNNHMGSQLTQMPRQMMWLMEELGRQNLYFIDSRTSVDTVAATIAEHYGIPSLSRNIFLDNERNIEAIDQQFKRLLQKARDDGIAVGIGHPYKETIYYLQRALPMLAAQGFKLALVSDAMGQGKKHLGPAMNL